MLTFLKALFLKKIAFAVKKSLKVVIGVWLLSFLLASPTLIGGVMTVIDFYSVSVIIQ